MPQNELECLKMIVPKPLDTENTVLRYTHYFRFSIIKPSCIVEACKLTRKPKWRQ